MFAMDKRMTYNRLLYFKAMNLKEYTTVFLQVLEESRTDADVIGNIIGGANNGEEAEREVREGYEWVAQEVRKAIGANKNLLGIFPEGPTTPEQQQEISKQEIRETDLYRHVLKVRTDIRLCLEQDGKIPSDEKSEVAKKVLTELSNRLKLQILGQVFGKKEKKAYRDEFAPKIVPKSNKKDGPLPPLKEMTAKEADKALEIINARLKAEGKIL